MTIPADLNRPAATGVLEPVRLAHKARALRQEAEELAERAKRLNEEARVIEEGDLPEAMDELGMGAFALADGTKVTIKHIVAGSIPAKNRAEAHAWLRAHGYADLIKQEVNVTVPRGMDSSVVVRAAEEAGLTATVEERVHPSTLGAWVRESLDEGIDLPLPLLGIFVGRRAEFKTP